MCTLRWRLAPSLLLAGLLAFTVASTLAPASLSAQVPTTVGYVGYLADDAGPVGYTVDIRVGLYEAEAPTSGEVALWAEEHRDVAVDQGRFYIELGSATRLDPDLFEQTELFLGFTIEDDVLAPRVPLSSVPFAFRAAHAARADAAAEAEALVGFDPDAVQPRFSVDCEDEGFVVAIDADGNASCAPVAEVVQRTEEEVAAIARGAAYDTEAELLGVLDGVYQARVTGSCSEGSTVRAINADGTVVCDADDVRSDADIDARARAVAYDTRAELRGELDGVYQARVAGACAEGSAVRVVNSDGSVLCEVDDERSDAEIDARARAVAYDTEAELHAALDDDYLAAPAFGAPTTVNGNTVTGLTPGARYLVTVYGITHNHDTGTATLGSVRVEGSDSTTLAQTPQAFSINWPDGEAPQSATFIITAPSSGSIRGYTCYHSSVSNVPARYMQALLLP